MRETYQELLDYFSNIPGVDLPGAKGAQGLKYNGKMFVMFYKGDITVQLPEERVIQIIESKDGLPHDPGTGKPMKNRVLIAAEQKTSWVKFCEESFTFVSKG